MYTKLKICIYISLDVLPVSILNAIYGDVVEHKRFLLNLRTYIRIFRAVDVRVCVYVSVGIIVMVLLSAFRFHFCYLSTV